MKKKAFTLVELAISAGLLSLLVFSVTQIYSNSSRGFKASSWKMTRQKEAKLLLLQFKEALEKASHFNIIHKNGHHERVEDSEVTIASTYYNKIASASNSGIVFASHCSPYIEKNPSLNTEEKLAVFKGFSLECYNKTLSFVQTGNSDVLMSTISSYPTKSVPNLENDKIKKNNKVGDSIVTVGDVDSIKVTVDYDKELASETCLLTLQLTMVMPNSGGQTTVKEEITAKISDVISKADKTKITVKSGNSLYPTASKRK